jgi:hypothetical protein
MEYLLGFRGEMVTNQCGEDKWHGPSWSFPFPDQYIEGSSKRETAAQLPTVRAASLAANEKSLSETVLLPTNRVKLFIPARARPYLK